MKKIGLILVAIVLGIISAYFAGSWYYDLYPSYGFFGWGGEAFIYLIGFPMGYLFFLFLFFTAFGGKKKYWWIGIAGAPALLFLAYFDFSHLYFHVLFPIVGWLIGWGVSRLIPQSSGSTL